jgi:hypothetical protein
MGKGTKEAGHARELKSLSLSELIHQHVRVVIETAVHEQLQTALGAGPHERSHVRRGYNGCSAPRIRRLLPPARYVATIASLTSGIRR